MDAELLRQPLDGAQREVPLPPLDRTDEGAVPADVLSEGLLGVAHLPPELSEVRADNELEVTFHGDTFDHRLHGIDRLMSGDTPADLGFSCPISPTDGPFAATADA
jgi:hypothetical protein